MPHPPMTPSGSELRRVRSLLSDLDAVVWEADAPTLTFTFVSEGATSILGYRPDEWLADPSFWVDHLHPEDRAEALSRFMQSASSGGAFDHEYRLVASDGSAVWVHDVGHVVRDIDGRPALLRGLMVEITERKAIERERVEAEERYRTLVEGLPGIVYLEAVERADPELPGRLHYVSPQVEPLLGFTPEAWTSDPVAWARQFHPDDRARVREGYERAETQGGPHVSEYRMFARDGTVHWFRDEAVLIRDEEGAPRWWQGFMLDVTEQRDAEAARGEAEARYRALVEQSPMITYLDALEEPAGTVYISPQATEVLGYTPEEWYADPQLWSRIVHPEDAGRHAQAEPGAAPVSSEYRVIAKDGRIVWILDRSRLITDQLGVARYWQGVLIDVTAEKEATSLRDDLRREREATQQLRAEDEMKTTFLHTVSHDLRTPLAAILGLAVTLEREDVVLRETEIRDLARRIAVNARRLDQMVAGFLDLERLQRGVAVPEIETFDLGGLVRELVASSDVAAGRRLALDVAPMRLSADRGMIERIVENLLANAARHTPGDSRIWVRLERVDEGVLLVVEDDGPGVAEADRSRIFEPFAQGPGAATGSGVGLALVARFAELHGGHAWVEERRGGGASFRVFLPDRPHGTGPGPTSIGQSSAGTGLP